MQSSLRIIFAGTPLFAAEHLQALLSTPHKIVAVFTQPDRRAGRGKKLSPSAVKLIAIKHHLPLHQPSSLRSALITQLIADYEADVMVVVAYGMILPAAILSLPRLGCINVHASLLPRWRGAAPIQRALLAGDEKTGITIMQMDAGLDTGAIIAGAECQIEAEETSASLMQKLSDLGQLCLTSCLSTLATKAVISHMQPLEGVTYAAKIRKTEAKICWSLSAALLTRQIRAFTPAPGSYFMLHDMRIKVWQAEFIELANKITSPPGMIVAVDKNAIVVMTGDGALRLLTLQLPNKKAAATAEILLVHRDLFTVGTMLSEVNP